MQSGLDDEPACLVADLVIAPGRSALRNDFGIQCKDAVCVG